MRTGLLVVYTLCFPGNNRGYQVIRNLPAEEREQNQETPGDAHAAALRQLKEFREHEIEIPGLSVRSDSTDAS
jgi:hypothetical protein